VAFNEKYVTVTGGGLHDGSSEANAWTLVEANSNMSVGDRLNVKAGNYTMPASLSAWPTGTSTNPCGMRGYKTSIGDLDANQTTNWVDGVDVPLFSASNGTAGFRPNGANNPWIIENMSFTSDYFQQNAAWCDGSGQHWRKCKFMTTATSSYYSLFYRVGAGNNHSRFENCYFSVPSNWVNTYPITISRSSIFHGCVFENIYDIQASNSNFINCVFKNAGGDLITHGDYAATVLIQQCTFYNISGTVIKNSTINGWNAWGGAINITNCVFHTISGDAVRGLSSTDYSYYLSNNLFYNITGSNFANSVCDSERNSITASSDPFNDAANDDFSLISTSDGYGSASPKRFLEISFDNGRDIGAVQHQDFTLGGGSSSPTYTSTAGTQMYPFRTLAEDDFDKGGTKFHPLS